MEEPPAQLALAVWPDLVQRRIFESAFSYLLSEMQRRIVFWAAVRSAP